VPSIIVNEKALSENPEIPPLHPPGVAWSMLTKQESHSILLPGGKRLGVWTLAICGAVLFVSTAVGAILFGGDDDRATTEPVTVDLDEGAVASSTEERSPNPVDDTKHRPGDTPKAQDTAAPSGDDPVGKGVQPESKKQDTAKQPEANTEETKPAESPGEPAGKVTRPTKLTSAAASKTKRTPSSGNKLSSTIDQGAVNRALATAAAKASRCKASGAAKGGGKVKVLFTPSGKARAATVVTPRFRGTSTASCVADVFRRVTIPPYKGKNVSALKSFTIN
jgi:hypothetical protein